MSKRHFASGLCLGILVMMSVGCMIPQEYTPWITVVSALIMTWTILFPPQEA